MFTPAMESPLALEFLRTSSEPRRCSPGSRCRLAGVAARGRQLTLRLTKPSPSSPHALGALCVVPPNLPIDPEGAQAPIPSAGPYYVAEYVPGERAILERNPFYRGSRPHHVDRFVLDLTSTRRARSTASTRGELDCGWPAADFNERRASSRGGTASTDRASSSSRATTCGCSSSTRDARCSGTTSKLRQAVNFAVDRKALTRERGPLAGTATDQYLPPALPGFRDARIYPLAGPD